MWQQRSGQTGHARPTWPGVIAICLIGLVLAHGVRTLTGYPICQSDEHNWVYIAAQVAQGVDWPISGPLHFGVTQWLANITASSHAQALATLGVLSVPFALLLLWVAYRKLGVTSPLSVIAVLCTSSYFWAPLLESRPQQWGQVLVLLGLALVWRALTDNRHWWSFAGIALLTAATHILSFGILVAATGLLWACMYVSGLAHASALLRMAIAFAPGVLVFLVPGGPYSAMLHDIRYSHLQFSGSVPLIMAGISVLGLVGFAGLVQLRKQANVLQSYVFNLVDRHVAAMSMFLAFAAMLALGMQAIMLPANAWEPYRGSVSLFLLSQSGNLFFLMLLLRGLFSARLRWLNGEDRTEAQTLTLLLMTAATLSCLSLLASFWMLHTNWMLRVINYGILWLAPLAAWGLTTHGASRAPWTRWVLCCMFALVSLLSAVRPGALFHC